eukprot:m51a1_g7180 putative tartrate dehydrogenase (364) ;mRNA; r:82610-83955
MQVLSAHLCCGTDPEPRTHRVLVYGGDGIGPDVVDEGVKCLRAAESCVGGFRLLLRPVDWGTRYWRAHGLTSVVPDDFLDVIRAECDALPDHVTLAPLVQMRQRLGQYICLRPARTSAGVPRALAGSAPVDLVVVRENSEGEYSGVGECAHGGSPDEVAREVAVHTRRGIERTCRYAFELARSRRKRVTLATKSNTLKYGMVLWDAVFEEVAQAFPDVRASRCHVDALCADFVRKPQNFDVVVGSNLFGDILSDLAGAVVGGLGLAPSANINPERQFPSMFEPVHGSAPDIAGRGIANPIGAIRAAAMMLDFLGEREAARVVDRAVEESLREGPRTPEIGGYATTSQVGNDIAARIARIARMK